MTYGTADASFIAAGGESGLRHLVEHFYREMDTLEEARAIRDMHPSDLTESIDKLARFLCGWLGGPKLYREKYGSISIPRAHSHLAIDETHRDAWLLCMERALTYTDYPEDFKAYLLRQLFVPANRCVNTEHT
ncbi:MAG: group II truncated hemoglobin [Pseudomonadales bacterium]